MAEVLETYTDAAVVNLLSSNLHNCQLCSVKQTDLGTIVKELQKKDLISLFFLLLDKIPPHFFLDLIRNDVSSGCEEHYLQEKFLQLGCFNEALLIELIGTIKAYKLLKNLGTCHHVFNQQRHSFSQVSDVWKCLYNLCEEISEDELRLLKEELKVIGRQKNLNTSCGQYGSIDMIDSAEELFCYALVSKIICKSDISTLIPVFQKVKPECLPLIILFTERSKNASSLKTYYMEKSSRTHASGIAVIFNHTTFSKDNSLNSNADPRLHQRRKTEIDVAQLKETWENFGFQTQIFDNLSDVEVKDKCISLSKLDHSNFNAFVMCYLSHGDKDVVYASNSKAIYIDYLIDIMANDCLTLAGKPKLFFIQACQGTQIQQSVAVTEPSCLFTDCPPKLVTPPKFCDIFKMVSTISGYVSFRDENGSWFVRALVKFLKEYGDKEDVTQVMKRVTDEVTSLSGQSNEKQTCVATSTLRRSVVFKRI